MSIATLSLPVGFNPLAECRWKRTPCPQPACEGHLLVEPLIDGSRNVVCSDPWCSYRVQIDQHGAAVIAPPAEIKAAAAPDELEEATCTVPGCERCSKYLDLLCQAHYSAWKRYGRPPLQAWIAAGAPKPAPGSGLSTSARNPRRKR